MDDAESLTADATVEPPTDPAAAGPPCRCPRCGSTPADPPEARALALPGARLWRCADCGQALGTTAAGSGRLERCETCARPILTPEGVPAEARCPDCTSAGGADAGVAADDRIVAATALELKLGLAAACRAVTAPGLVAYLDGLTLRMAAAVGGTPEAARVALLHDPRPRSVAFPDGTIVLSTGLLESMRDEAELAFALARELAHLASGAAARSVVALGLPAVARGGDAAGSGWGAAVEDLLLLGHGDAAEFAADGVAVDALLAAGYDPRSALRQVERQRPEGAAPALARPPARERTRAIERRLAGRGADRGGGRTNREPFRRVVGRLAGPEPIAVDAATVLRVHATPDAVRSWSWAWTVAAIATLALLVLVLGLVLR